MGAKQCYRFGDFRLDVATHLLWKGKRSQPLSAKVHGLLCYLLQHPQRLLSHDELFAAVWPRQVVEDTALRLAINNLRKTLHDDCRTPRYIATVCKLGYRFLPEVYIEHNSVPLLERAVPASQMPDLAFAGASTDLYAAELHALQAALWNAFEGQRRLVFLHGERGCGKTELLNRFLADRMDQSLTVLRARCVPLGSTMEPFLPLLEAFERRCRSCEESTLRECLQSFAPSWLSYIQQPFDTPSAEPIPLRNLDFSPGQMLREAAGLFESLSAEKVFVLILDNSQWSDEFTLDLLNFLLFRCSPARMLIIVCYRSGEDTPALRRLQVMREELTYRGVCEEIELRKR